RFTQSWCDRVLQKREITLCRSHDYLPLRSLEGPALPITVRRKQPAGDASTGSSAAALVRAGAEDDQEQDQGDQPNNEGRRYGVHRLDPGIVRLPFAVAGRCRVN